MTSSGSAPSASRPATLRAMRYASLYLCLLTMEVVLHYMYVVAIKDARAWAADTPVQLCMLGFWNLIVVWLKLLLPWRFFRLCALADGVELPENMVRCMANNYLPKAFWRAWHRSFNLWTTRHVFHPRTPHPALLTPRRCVYIPHDLSFKLLAWGWLISLFILPEIIANLLLPASKYGEHWWYRHLCAAGAVGNILMMMGANMVGFVLGVDGIKYLLSQLTGTVAGWQFLIVACIVIFMVVHLMFEYREEKKRQGISRRF
ncbi:glycerol uptake protein 1 [Exidia glandulosa HHB12029]|uniref:Glycerol uptake protein 1 n=1 Tax=Exidia glandulosa HHB12029 TaxID=1314781 RepID=A0A165KLD7_EXIGL|nr:glycerol uptake protein 1 [Exidia glandulosa HHB12029]